MYLYGIKTEINNNKIYPFLLLIDDKNKYEFNIYKNSYRKINAFISPLYKIKKKVEISFEEIFNHSWKNGEYILSFDKNELDVNLNYISINSNYFIKSNSRQKEKQPIWIFNGESMLGKSYLASFMFEEKEIYETDSSNSLPNNLNYDIIVLGNKYVFTKDEIEKRIDKNREIIWVNFSKK